MWANGRMISSFTPKIILGDLERAVSSQILFLFWFSRSFMSNVLTFLAGSHSGPGLRKVDLSLVQRFNSLSEDQRSYKNIITHEQISRHSFYLPALTSASASTSGEVG